MNTPPQIPRPLVSVILPFLNAERFLAEAIESVQRQTYPVWELLLVDDGSDDGSTAVAQRYARLYPERIRYLQHEGHANRGVCASRNLGIRYAGGTLIALLDADDVWLPEKLSEQVALMEAHPRVAMVFGKARYWSANAEDTDAEDERDAVAEDETRAQTPDLGLPPDRPYEPPELFTRCHPLGSATAPCPSDLLLRRQAVRDTGGFEESFVGKKQLYEDQAFLVKIYLRYPVFVAGRTWIHYRIHSESCMARVDDQRAVRLYFLQWLADYLQQQNVDPDVWRGPLEGALEPYRHPLRTEIAQRGLKYWRRGRKYWRRGLQYRRRGRKLTKQMLQR